MQPCDVRLGPLRHNIDTQTSQTVPSLAGATCYLFPLHVQPSAVSAPYLQVLIDGPLAGCFSYRCPAEGPEPVGHWVTVPWGKGRRTGLALQRHDASTLPAGLKAEDIKPIEAVREDLPAPSPEWLAFLRFVARYYHGSLADLAVGNLPKLLRTPPTARSRKDAVARLEDFSATLDDGHDAPSTAPELNAEQQAVLAELCTWQGARPDGSAPAAPAPEASTGSPVPAPAANSAANGSPLSSRARTEADPSPTSVASLPAPRPWLLHGITGSGKTEVYLHWMERLLASQPDVQVLLMVPEIGLTPALQMQLQRRFPGQPIAVLHSEMTDAARASHWLAAASGRARIILGTRLAVLAPLPRLGAIIVDEEHDPSYKQQEGLRYSARDMAVARGRLARIPVLLGSATPSLESWHNAQLGRYRLLRLRHRARSQAALPKVKTVALRGAKTQEGLAEESLQAIRETLARGEQALLFLNRRGFAPVLGCDACGWLSRCNRCDAYRVLHRISPGAGERKTKASAARAASRPPSGTPGNPPGTGDEPSLGILTLDEARESGDQRPPRYRLVCHHCATTQTVPRACPACGNQDLAPLGRGTQKLEDALATLFPSAHIGRLDRDVARRKGATQAFLDDVHAGRTNLLVGTQMLAKGHDFDRLTLVVVVDADAGLFTTDFRAPERLFATLIQVAGRAGRHRSEHARTLIQTRHPEHPLFESLRRHDYPSFAAAQLADRQAGALPPFGFQALLQAQARDLDSALAFLQDARQYLLQAIQTARTQQQRPGTSGHGSGPSKAFSAHSNAVQRPASITNYAVETQQTHASANDVITNDNKPGNQAAFQAPAFTPASRGEEAGSVTSSRIIDNDENSTRYRGSSIHPDAHVEICDPVPMPLAQVNKVFRTQLLIESSHRPSLHTLLASWQASVGAGDHATGVAGSAAHHHKGVRWQLIIDPQEI